MGLWEEIRFGVVISLIIVAIIGSKIYLDEKSCARKWQNSRYEFPSGCLVLVDGQYIPEKNLIVYYWSDTDDRTYSTVD